MQNIQNSKILIKRSSTTGVVPTIPVSTDHTDGTWLDTDIYEGEMFINLADERIWFRSTSGIHEILFTGSNPTFLSLTDTPAGYAGSSLYGVRVNIGETALEFYEITDADVLVALDGDPTNGFPLSSSYFETTGSPATAIIPIERINDGGAGLTDLWSGNYITSNIAALVTAAMGVAGNVGDIQINNGASPEGLGAPTSGNYAAATDSWNFSKDGKAYGNNSFAKGNKCFAGRYGDRISNTDGGGTYFEIIGDVTTLWTLGDNILLVNDGIADEALVVDTVAYDAGLNITTITPTTTFTDGSFVHLINMTTSISDNNSAEGERSLATNSASHVEGYENISSSLASHAEGYLNSASAPASHAEGSNNKVTAASAHVEGDANIASGAASHAEGSGTTASGINSHVEGIGTTASGAQAHAEGNKAEATGDDSHAEGSSSIASGNQSHAQGQSTIASGIAAHSEGEQCVASGDNSHAQGVHSEASGEASSAIGDYAKASNPLEFANGGGLVNGQISQKVEIIMQCITTDDNPTLAKIGWDDYTVNFVPRLDSSYLISAMVIMRTASGASSSIPITNLGTWVLKNVSGVNTIVSGSSVTGNGDEAPFDQSEAIDIQTGSVNEIKVLCTGIAATTVYWTILLTMVEICVSVPM